MTLLIAAVMLLPIAAAPPSKPQAALTPMDVEALPSPSPRRRWRLGR